MQLNYLTIAPHIDTYIMFTSGWNSVFSTV